MSKYPERITLNEVVYEARLTPTRIVVKLTKPIKIGRSWQNDSISEVQYNSDAGLPSHRGATSIHGRVHFELMENGFGESSNVGKLPHSLTEEHAETATPALAERIFRVFRTERARAERNRIASKLSDRRNAYRKRVEAAEKKVLDEARDVGPGSDLDIAVNRLRAILAEGEPS